MKLAEIVPWGRTREEYRRMFNLTEADLRSRILGVGDGPASFNAEQTAVGHPVVSIDPIYAFSAEEIEKRIGVTYQEIIEQLRNHKEQYNWTLYQNADELGDERMKAMKQFLTDYENGRQQGRYQTHGLPALPFSDQSFDLAVCSHLLFLYSDQLSEAFHLASVQELIRVANKVRIFPLISLAGKPSPYLKPVLADCQATRIQAEIVDVPYHFQKGAYQMLQLTRIA
ncbi:SAM-dependent methyltransferase [Spirosoma koreense]